MPLEQRRQAFVKFAREKGFDPTIPEYWYSLSAADILSSEVYENSKIQNSKIRNYQNLQM
jgi:hypothetical protein